MLLGTVSIFLLAGCQPNGAAVEEVVNEHNDIQNAEALHTFIKKVKIKKEASLNYSEYGVEGQHGVTTLSYQDNHLHVSRSVDEELIEKYRCKDIAIETKASTDHYVLKQCTGEFEGSRDFPLLTITE